MVENAGRHPVSGLESWWNHALDPLRGVAARVGEFFSPPSEASGSDQFYEIHVELPGVEEKDIEITLNENVLLIRGERKFERKEEGRTYFFSERSYGRFQRTFRLPGDVDEEKVFAQHRDGVLTVKLAKKAPGQATGRRIDISSG